MKDKMQKTIFLTFIFNLIFVFYIYIHNLFGKECSPTVPNPELIVNGSFELGMFGFRTKYDTNYIKFPKNIRITSNPYNEYYTFDSCSDPLQLGGKFLIVNGNDIYDNIEIVWEQTIEISPHNYYLFQFMYTNIDSKVDTNKNLPILQLSFDEETFDTIYIPKPTCFWQKFQRIWYSNDKEFVTIRIRDLKKAFFGNDFAIDEISFKSLCDVQACAGGNREICLGDTTILGDIVNNSASQGFKPYSFRWFPEVDLNSPYVPNPLAFPKQTTTYYIEVTDSLGCVAYDSVTVFVHYPPLSNITINRGIPVCPCDSVTLFAVEGLTYLWSTGDTTPSIIVKKPGYYSLRVRNQYGCTDTSGIYIDFYKINTQIKIDTIEAEIGSVVTLPIKIIEQDNFFNCEYREYELEIEYDRTVLFPIDHQPTHTSLDREKLSLKGQTISNELEELKFFVTLGKSDFSNVQVKTFKWNCDKIEVDVFNGRINVQGICREGGVRLVDFNSNFLVGPIYPNPITTMSNFYLNLIEKGHTRVYIRNNLGEIVKVITDSSLDPGRYIYSIDAENLPTGLFYLFVESPNLRKVQVFQVLH